MSSGDSIIGIVVVAIFFFIIASKVYNHEKDNLSPTIDKIKSWFARKKEDVGESSGGLNEDYDLEFAGRMK